MRVCHKPRSSTTRCGGCTQIKTAELIALLARRSDAPGKELALFTEPEYLPAMLKSLDSETSAAGRAALALIQSSARECAVFLACLTVP